MHFVHVTIRLAFETSEILILITYPHPLAERLGLPVIDLHRAHKVDALPDAADAIRFVGHSYGKVDVGANLCKASIPPAGGLGEDHQHVDLVLVVLSCRRFACAGSGAPTFANGRLRAAPERLFLFADLD